MTRQRLEPADLKDGCYIKPFAHLEIDQLWAGLREVWTASHGRAARYHVMVDGGVAACRPKQTLWKNRSVILLCNHIPIGEVAAHMCCRRNGCRQIFEAFLA
jgi:hypothetical protein